MRIITLLIFLLAGTMFWGANTLCAQTSPIDTIVVDLSGNKSPQDNIEPTPTLNIDALRNLAREDSIKLAEMKAVKEEAELVRIQELKEKREKERKEKEKTASAEAAKRKLEKASKERAAQEKKATAKLAKEAKNKEKARLKQADKKANELAQEKLAQEKQAAELAENERKRKAKLAEKEFEKEEQQKAAAEKAATLNKIAENKRTEPESTNPPVLKTNQKPLSDAQTTKTGLPQVPTGIKQEDNEYGTVRLAFDDLAASFLLSIPTETKMQYHPNHSKHIMLVEGEGMMLMGYKTIKLKKNELIFVTKGTPHKIINSGKGKVKVLSIMSPFYDGTDVIILE